MSAIVKKELTPPHVSRETMEKLKEYYHLLLQWNKSLSLVEDLPWDLFYHRHILDALQISPLIENDFIDIGSGGGIPGIPLAFFHSKGYLVESNKKKSSFLSFACKKLQLNNIEVLSERIENLSIPQKITITSRALAPLDQLFSLLKNVSRETNCLFLKGHQYEKEIKNAEKEWLFDYDLYRSISCSESVIIHIKDFQRR